MKDLNFVSEIDSIDLVGKVDQLKRRLNKLISKINNTGN